MKDRGGRRLGGDQRGEGEHVKAALSEPGEGDRQHRGDARPGVLVLRLAERVGERVRAGTGVTQPGRQLRPGRRAHHRRSDLQRNLVHTPSVAEELGRLIERVLVMSGSRRGGVAQNLEYGGLADVPVVRVPVHVDYGRGTTHVCAASAPATGLRLFFGTAACDGSPPA